MPPRKKAPATSGRPAKPTAAATAAAPVSPQQGSFFRVEATSPRKDVHVTVGVQQNGGGKKGKAAARAATEEAADEVDGDDEARDEELDMLAENYEIETSSRTQILRDRIKTVFLPMLLRRFAREMGRLTPDMAEVTAEEHMVRDGGSLRRTLEVVGQSRMANVLRAGEKRAADEDLDEEDERGSEVDRMGLGMTDIEKSARKRKRVHPPQANGKHEGEGVDGSYVVVPGRTANGRAKGKGKAVERNGTTRNGKKPDAAFNWTATSTSAGFLHPQLPQTPSLDRTGATAGKKPRPARRNESLISVNGSPVLAAAEDDEEGMDVDDLQLDGVVEKEEEAPHRRKRASSVASASGGKGKGKGKGNAKPQKATPIRRSYSRGSSDEEGQQQQKRPPQGAFEFAQSSRWRQLEEELARTDMELGAKAKLREMLAHLRVAEMTG